MPVTADLSIAIQGDESAATQLDVVVAEPRNIPTRLGVLTTASAQRTAGLDVSVLDAVSTVCLLPEMSLAVAEPRDCPVPLDVLIDTGRQVALDVLVVTTPQLTPSLDVYVRSPDLGLGVAVVFSCDGDEVQMALTIDDLGVVRPELLQSISATLRFRQQPQGTVTIEPHHVDDDGLYHAAWLHPAHTSDMDVRLVGIVETLGAIDVTVPVSIEQPRGTLVQNVSPLDDERPRLQDPGTAREQQLDAAPEEVEVLDASLEPLLLSLDFSRQQPLVVGDGVVEYLGGGNRLLRGHDGSFIFQAKDAAPWGLDAVTSVEAAGQNLLSNSDFLTPSASGVPVGWSLTASSSVTTLPTLEAVGSLNAARIRAFGSGPYLGPKSYRLSLSQSVAITGPTTFSLLARTQFGENVDIEDLRLIVSLRDVLDVELSSVTATFDPAGLQDWMLLANPIASLPGGTQQARVSIEMESIETSDDHVLYLMAPNLQPGVVATSSIVGALPVGRAADTVRIQQNGNIEPQRGNVAVTFVTAYNGVPAADACLFDTRDVTGRDGFAAFHLADGRLRFIVAGPATDVTLNTVGTFAFVVGDQQTVACSWAQDFAAIHHDDVEVALSTASNVLPDELPQYLYLFRTTADLSRLDGQLQNVVIERDIVT